MSVISSLPVIPNRLYLLLKQLALLPRGISREKLAELMNPPSLSKGKKTNIFSPVLNEAMKLGLVVELPTENGEKILQLAADIPKLDDETNFIFLMEKRLLQDLDDDKLWDRGRFPEALAWFLMQNPLKPIAWDKNVLPDVERYVGDQCEAFELTNKARFQNLIYWARFLGYAVKLGFTATEQSEEIDPDENESQIVDFSGTNTTAYVLPDPTAAIARHLPGIFRKESQLNVSDFKKAWALLLPVLEGGVIRKALEQQVGTELARQDHTFSRATSLALRRLEQRRIIKLLSLSDADMYVLDYGNDQTSFSHITYLLESI